LWLVLSLRWISLFSSACLKSTLTFCTPARVVGRYICSKTWESETITL
jgi:hypothetical protein